MFRQQISKKEQGADDMTWTISNNISAETRSAIESLIATTPLDENVDFIPKINGNQQTISSQVSDEKRSQIEALLSGCATPTSSPPTPSDLFLFGGETVLSQLQSPDEGDLLTVLPSSPPCELGIDYKLAIDPSSNSILFRTNSGGIWESVFPTPPPIIHLPLLSSDSANHKKIGLQATITLNTTDNYVLNRGEQAGLFLHSDNDNYVKLVVEGGSDGDCKLIFAKEIGGAASVVDKVADIDATSDVTIRLEFDKSGEGTKITACMSTTYCLRKLGSVELGKEWEGNFGVSAHGGTTTRGVVSGGNWASLKDVIVFGVAGDRVNL